MDDTPPPDGQRPARLDPGAAWGWLRPWIGNALLIAVALFGIVSASGAAAGSSSYQGGLIVAALAIIALFLRIKHAFDGVDDGLLLDMRIRASETLWLFLPVMIALAVAGMLIAAASVPGVYHFFGLALFSIATLLIFLNLKLFYDAQDRHRR